MRTVANYRELWSVLNGIICVHIPAVEGLNYVKKRIVEAICEGGNRSIPEIRLPVINMPVVEAHHKSQALIVVGWKKQSDYRYKIFI